MCGATKGGVSTEGLDLTDEAVVQGVVTRDGEPVANAYVRFFAAPGTWTLRTLAPKAEPVDRTVVAARGEVADVEVLIG